MRAAKLPPGAEKGYIRGGVASSEIHVVRGRRFALGRAVLSSFSFAVFALGERKNGKP